MSHISPKPIQEIARTTHSIITKCTQGHQFVVVKQNTPANSRSKDRWQTEVDALRIIGYHVRIHLHNLHCVSEATLTYHKPHITTLLCSSSSHESPPQVFSITLRHEPGHSLDTFVDDARMSTLPCESCQTILLQIAGALSYIHALGIIHDDVKPENIIWSPPDGRAVLIDFGATLFDSQYSESGTPAYAPPEYLTRSLKTCKSDVWALGVVMAFAFGFFPLPTGDWLLPNALQTGSEERREMEEWLASIMSVTERVIDRKELLLGQMLKRCSDARIDSRELFEKLSVEGRKATPPKFSVLGAKRGHKTDDDDLQQLQTQLLRRDIN